jgi:hypothetical protein
MLESGVRPYSEAAEKAKMTRGSIIILPSEIAVLKLRSKFQRKTQSAVIQEIVEPVVAQFENLTVTDQEVFLQEIEDHQNERMRHSANHFRELGVRGFDVEYAAYDALHWVLPRTLVDRVDQIAVRGTTDYEMVLGCIVSDAIGIRPSS